MSSQPRQPPKQLDLSAALPSSMAADTGPASPQHDKDAARGMSSAAEWEPALGARRPSYRQEDRKHELQMAGIAAERDGAPGFSES